MAIDLHAATTQLQHIADGVGDGHLQHQTPCEGRTVAQLLGHVTGLTLAFRAAAAKDLGELTDANPDASGWSPAADDWRAALADRLPALADAWRAPEAWTGMTRAGGVDLPGEVAGLVALDELVLHGWDLARATGQDYAVDDATATAVLGFVTQFDEAGTPGLFGPAVTVGEDAPVFERLLARSGRDPHWSPGWSQGDSNP